MPDQWTWTPPDGGPTLDFTDRAGGYMLLAEGTRGLYSVGYDVTDERYAGQDGTTAQAISAKPGSPVLQLLVQADTEATFRARRRALVRSLRPRVAGEIAPGTLTCRSSDGSVWSLTCYALDGYRGDESAEAQLPGRWWKTTVELYAEDPFWWGVEETIDFGLGAPTPFFPFFPLVLSPSSVQGALTVDLSDCDALVYPLWRVTGPGSALLMTNTFTTIDPVTRLLAERTLSIQVGAGVGDGQSMLLDTRPGMQSVRRDDGTNLMPAVSTDPALWPLVEGSNKLSVLLTGANASSRIIGTFRRRRAGI